MSKTLGSMISNINLQQAKPVRLFEQAVEQIRELIQLGHLKPGDKLPSESALSQMLSISRSSVREALRALESRGLIQVRPGAGACISEDALVLNSITDAIMRLLKRKDLVLQILEARIALECLAVSQAALNTTPAEIAELEDILNCQKAIIKSGDHLDRMAELAQLDIDFHVAISKASGNEIVQEIIRELVSLYFEDDKSILFVEKAYRLVDEHRLILSALTRSDPDGAKVAMENHIRRVMQEILEINQINQ
jgi:GntR family transcriptional regulator, transcriptional repressor for pyruvate dehydrogenase complex